MFEMSLKAAVPTYTCEYGDCENESRIQSPCCRKFYCSNEHSSSDIAGHAKENCPIFSVQQTNSGTKAVANFNLDKTQEKTVFEEEPVMMLPSVALQETCDEFICINCGLVIKSNSIDDSRCVLCQWPLCSGGCHFEFTENATNCHTPMECTLLRKARHKNGLEWDGDTRNYWCIWLIRFALLRSRAPELFSCLKESCGGMKKAPDGSLEMVEKLAGRFVVLRSLLKELNWSKILWLVANKFRCARSSSQKKLVGLYYIHTAISHSCDPNLGWTVNCRSNRLGLCVLKKVEVGEELSICYDDAILVMPTHLRHMKLQREYGFTCNCARCVDPSELGTHFSSLLCPSCLSENESRSTESTEAEYGWLVLCGLVIADKNYKCSRCDGIFDWEFVRATEEKFQKNVARSWNSAQFLKAKLLRVLWDRQSNKTLIHEMHYHYFFACLRLMELLLSEVALDVWSEEQFWDFIPYAETVHEIGRKFGVFKDRRDGVVSGPFRMASVILLVALIVEMKASKHRLDSVEEQFRDIFFWKENLSFFHLPAVSIDDQFPGDPSTLLVGLERKFVKIFVSAVKDYIDRKCLLRRLSVKYSHD